MNTGYIRRVIIESEKGISMDDMDFVLEFYVLKSKKLRFRKSDLIHAVNNGESMYFVALESRFLGPGEVKCKAIITDPEIRYLSGKRIVELTRMTGLTIGLNCPCGENNYDCECFEEGYRIRFEPYEDIPSQDGDDVMYGVIKTPITGFDKITEDMVLGFTHGPLENSKFTFEVGDKIVILVKDGLDIHAYKDSGFGDLVEFDESVLGINGGISMSIDGIHYRIYGEMMLLSGEIYVTVK